MREIISNSTVYELVLVSILIIAFLIQLYYYLGIYLKVVLYKNKLEEPITPNIPISVIICARDEEENLLSFLPSVMEQEYPDFEVVVVNDCSSDNSEYTLEALAKKYPNLRVTTIKQDEKFTHNKKLALTVGIKAAKNNWLVLTDADCKPDSKKWLSTMAAGFSDSCEIVLGYGGFFEGKGFLNKLIRFDGLFIAMQYFGFALNGRPYMGVGRNLAYRKDLFFKNKGFASHAHLCSGDDDLFINEVAKKSNTRVEFRPEAHTKTIPRNSYKRWVIQKRRHITTSKRYNLFSKIMLSGEITSRVLFFGSSIALLAMIYYPWVIGSIFMLRWVVQLSIIKGVMNRLSEKKLLLLSLLYDFYSLFFYGGLLLLNRLNPRKPTWR
ncbi:MAG: glycosyltransferase [Bacteroidales bacterium]|nr:glycosyltransferase [Bacteroidales bacterium]